MTLLEQAQQASAQWDADEPKRKAKELQEHKEFLVQEFYGMNNFKPEIEMIERDWFFIDGVRFHYHNYNGWRDFYIHKSCTICGTDISERASPAKDLCRALEGLDKPALCQDCQ